ncbi:MAG TPA: peptide ABC transporter substrate-binding protein [Gammaproteobacteria bacterium]|nr:peptide ABC transporter substrate-binding protein [Gammaproteobacteria bacterium]
MKKRIRWLAVAALGALAAAALAGCGGGGGAAQAREPVGGATGNELAQSQVLHLGNGAEIQTLDPQRGQDIPSSNVARDVFEGLVDEAPNGDPVPGAAESWTMSDDGKTYRFKLRRDGRWSNGDPVTASDFVYGLRRGVDPATASAYSFILSPIVNADEITAGHLKPSELGVRALDDHTLEIVLKNPTPYFIILLAHSITYPLHRATVEKYGEQFTRPGNLVGNGAFMLAEWVVQSHIKLVRNPYYWDNASNKLDEVWYYPTENQSAELKRYRAGELDQTYWVPTAELDWIRKNLPDELLIAPYLATYYYGFNLTRPPFQDNLNLRRALTLAVNREVITKQVLGAGQIPAFGLVPPVSHYTGQQMPEAAWTQEQREAEAKRLYAAAGYSAEKPLRTEIIYNTEDDHRRIAVAIASMWKQVLGVETAISQQEWKVFLDTRNQRRDTQVYRNGWTGDYNDAFTFAELYRSNAGLNDSGYDNPEYDRLVTAAQSELDLDKRAELLQHAERVLLGDLPILPLYFYVSTRMTKPWVKGYYPNIMDHQLHKNFYVLKH